MKDVLTQKDIDALRAADDRSAQADVRPYDFARPRQLPREQLAILESVADRVATGLQTRLGSQLRATVEVEVRAVERTSWGDVQLALEPPCAAFVFDLGGAASGPALLDFGPEVAYHVIDRFFGGTGESSRLNRPLTPLEQQVVQELATATLADFAEGWAEHAAIAPAIVTFESDPELLQIAARDDETFVVILEMRSGGFSGLVTLAVPAAVLSPLWRVIEARRALPAPSAAVSEEERARVAAGLRGVTVTLAARLPRIRLHARDVAALQAGRVFKTGLPCDAPVEILVNGKVRYLGTLGQSRKRIGVRITQVAAETGNQPDPAMEGRLP